MDHDSSIKRDPENFEDMKRKLQQKDERDLKKTLDRHDVKTTDELQESVLKAIRVRSDRKTDYKTLANRAIIENPQSQEVLSERDRLNQEIKSISKRIFAEIPATAKRLRGRINISEEPGTETRTHR